MLQLGVYRDMKHLGSEVWRALKLFRALQTSLVLQISTYAR